MNYRSLNERNKNTSVGVPVIAKSNAVTNPLNATIGKKVGGLMGSAPGAVQ